MRKPLLKPRPEEVNKFVSAPFILLLAFVSMLWGPQLKAIVLNQGSTNGKYGKPSLMKRTI